MQGAQDSELVPLKVGFDIAWRGYHRAQVKQHLEDVADELRLMAADRDAALSQVEALTQSLEALRSDTDSLRAEVHKLSRGPVTGGELSERLQRMLELANSEAAEITANANAGAAATVARAQQTANALRERHDRLLIDLREQQRALHAEHRALMTKARAEVEQMHKQAALRCQALDAGAANRRGAVEEDFRISMADRRRRLDKEITELRTTSKAEADRLVRTATTKAESLVSDATEAAQRQVAEANSTAEHRLSTAQQQVDTLRALREQLNGQLTSALDLMRDAAPLLADEDTQPGEPPENAGHGQDTVRTAPVQPEQERDQQVPGQRHSAVPPSRGKSGTKPRLTPVNAGSEQRAR